MPEQPAATGQDLPSRVLYEGFHRAPARSFLYGIGYTREALERPIVGVAHSWTSTMPCNFNHRDLAAAAEAGVREAGGTPMQFSTIAISDGITMGTDGMRASLISREVIADSIELVASGHHFDALVCIASCDKTTPGCAMALARVNRPAVLLYGGTIMPGLFRGRRVAVGEVFEAVGAVSAGQMDPGDLDELERVACPGAGACGGQYTANTMSMVMEAIGLSPLGLNSIPATDPAKPGAARDAGALAMQALAAGVRPRDVLTRPAFLNAVAAATASGGSTNAVLHLLAMARETGVELSLDDIDAVSKRTPLLGDLKPGGRFTAAELYDAGGAPTLLRELLGAGLIDGSAVTVTGRTLGEELERLAPVNPAQQVIRPVQDPLSPEGDLCVLRGNIAPRGRGGEGDGIDATAAPRPGAGLRRGAGCPRRRAQRQDHRGRHGGHPVRRPPRRSGHAGDAAGHRRYRRPRPGGGGGTDHRRPVQRRHPGTDGRARLSRGGAGRPARQDPRRRPDRDRRRAPRGRRARCRPGRATARRQPQASTAAGVYRKYAESVGSAATGAVTAC